MFNKSTALFFLYSLFSLTRAFAYSAQGHEGIAEYAHTHVSEKTRKILDEYFLKDNAFIRKLNTQTTGKHKIPEDDLAKIAVWADDVKFSLRHMRGTPLLNDSKAAEFNKNFIKNGDWHFLNLPLDTESFSEKSIFNPDNMNVVDAINGAIHVLEGKASGYGTEKNNGIDFTKKQALLLLVHLMGDLHQPLHVGSGYFRLPRTDGYAPILINSTDEILVTDPAMVYQNEKFLPSDIGGNSIHLKKSDNEDLTKIPSLELHAVWDDKLVQVYAGTTNKDAHTLALKMTDQIENIDSYREQNQDGSNIDYHDWVALWATDSIHQCKKVYQGLTFNSVTLNDRGGIKTILATKDDHYEENQAGLVASQLEKAGARLTLLLDHIQWDLSNITDNTAD